MKYIHFILYWTMIAFVILILIGYWLLAGLMTARAASECENVPGFVVVQAASLRVRSGRGITYDTLRFVGRDDILPVPSTEAVSGWWGVCPEGFVSAGYVRFEAAATPTPTPTPTATARPVVIVTQTPRATPTQIQHNFIWCSTEPEVRRIGDSWIVECER